MCESGTMCVPMFVFFRPKGAYYSVFTQYENGETCILGFVYFRPKGAYGVPIQYERSFRWKLGQFRYLCQVNLLIIDLVNYS